MAEPVVEVLNFFRDEAGGAVTLTRDTDLALIACPHEDDFERTFTAFSDGFGVDFRAMDVRFHLYPEMRTGPRVRPYIPLTARLLAEAVVAGKWRMTYPQPPDGGWSEGNKGWWPWIVFSACAVIVLLW